MGASVRFWMTAAAAIVAAGAVAGCASSSVAQRDDGIVDGRLQGAPKIAFDADAVDVCEHYCTDVMLACAKEGAPFDTMPACRASCAKSPVKVTIGEGQQSCRAYHQARGKASAETAPSVQ